MKKIIKNLLFFTLFGFVIYFILENYDFISGSLRNQVENVLNIEDRSNFDILSPIGEMIEDEESIGIVNNITGDEYSFDIEFYPYYGLLSSSHQEVYKQVYANILALEKTFVPKDEINIDDMEKIMECIYNDHPELFWLDTTYSYKYNFQNICVQITLSFNETVENFEESKHKYDEAVSLIVDAAHKYDNVLEKESFVHDVLINGVSYDVNSSANQSSFSALVNRISVCAGYARAFQHVMTEIGVPTYFVTGTANGDHAWNIIKIDGNFYNVDLTWDDVQGDRRAYFNVSDDQIENSHARGNLSSFLPKCKTNLDSKTDIVDYTFEEIKVNNNESIYDTLIPNITRSKN